MIRKNDDGLNITNIIRILIILGSLGLYNISFGDIYKYEDNEGILHLTNLYDSEPCKTYGCKRVLREIPRYLERISDNFYYNKTNMTKSYNSILVWTYSFVTEEERNKMKKEKEKLDSDKSLKYLSYTHESVLFDIDCDKKMKKINKITYRDWNGNILDEYTKETSDWDIITPQSKFELLYDKVCVNPNKPSKKKK